MTRVGDDQFRPLVMVVDDEPDLVELVTDILILEGFPSLGVSNCDEALTAARHAEPNLFLIDVMMHDVSGIELARRLRANGFSHTPCIAVSGFETMLAAARDSALFDGYLRKPFDVDELAQAVNCLIRDTAAL